MKSVTAASSRSSQGIQSGLNRRMYTAHTLSPVHTGEKNMLTDWMPSRILSARRPSGFLEGLLLYYRSIKNRSRSGKNPDPKRSETERSI